MNSLAIFIFSFVFLCAYANGNETSTEEATTRVPSCRENEVYNKCICRPDACWTLRVNIPCDNKDFCLAGCECREGYLRLTRLSPCRPKEKCPQFRN